MENFELNNNDNQSFDTINIFDLDHIFDENEVNKIIPIGDNAISESEPPSLPSSQDVQVPEAVVLITNHSQIPVGVELPRIEVAAPSEPLPSTSRGLAVAIPSNSCDIAVAEPVSVPTLSTEVLLKLRKPSKKVQRNKVPEELKDEKYLAQRSKNILSARNSRAKKRIIDEERVALIKRTMKENDNFRQEVLRLRGIEARCMELQNQNALLRNVCQHLCSKLNELGGNYNFPAGL